MTLLLPLLASLSAFAQAPGYYHPADVAAHSRAFAKVQDIAATAFEDRATQAAALSRALHQAEVALDALGPDAPANQRERLADLTRTYNRQFAALQAHAQDQLDAYDSAFSSALTQALADRDLTRCQPDAGRGLRLTRGTRGPDTACTGEDANPTLAQVLDNNRGLWASLDKLTSIPWPSFDLPLEPVDPVGTGPWLPLADLLTDHAGPTLTAIDQADEDARLGFQAAIEDGATIDELRALQGEARAVTATTAARRAALAAPLLDLVDRLNTKAARKGQPTLSWCAQPAALGGCSGTPASAAQQQALTTPKPFAKAVTKGIDAVEL